MRVRRGLNLRLPRGFSFRSCGDITQICLYCALTLASHGMSLWFIFLCAPGCVCRFGLAIRISIVPGHIILIHPRLLFRSQRLEVFGIKPIIFVQSWRILRALQGNVYRAASSLVRLGYHGNLTGGGCFPPWTSTIRTGYGLVQEILRAARATISLECSGSFSARHIAVSVECRATPGPSFSWSE